jgi:hypothetical protein
VGTLNLSINLAAILFGRRTPGRRRAVGHRASPGYEYLLSFSASASIDGTTVARTFDQLRSDILDICEEELDTASR